MSVPRDHHFIPAFYLKQWTTNGTLIEYTRKHGKLIAKPVGAKATGYERDLYAFPELPAADAQHIEAVFLNQADDMAAQALAIHLGQSKVTWSAELRSAWSRFLIGLHVRHPDAMKEIRPGVVRHWQNSAEITQREYEKYRSPEDPPTFDEYWADRDPLLVAKVCVNMVTTAIFDNPNLGAHINNMIWRVADLSAAQHRFVTSDRPVMFVGVRQPDGYAALAISPTRLFIAANRKELLAQLFQKNPNDVVTAVNDQVVSRARRFVYAADETERQFIEDKMSTNLEATPFFPSLNSD
jgi:hypothetical protein